MSNIQIAHDTIQLSQVISASVDQVWGAYAESAVRAQWSVPAGEGLVYQFDDFRKGGRAAYLCGPADNLEFHGSVEYLVVAEPQSVVYLETIRSGDQLLTAALLTWQFQSAPNGTNLTVTNQLTSFVGQDMIEGNRNGHRIALEQLTAQLTGTTASSENL